MADLSIRIQMTLTAWHEWQPFGIGDFSEWPQLGIKVDYVDSTGEARQIALETMATISTLLSAESQAALHDAYELARQLAQRRLNEMPYQLPLC